MKKLTMMMTLSIVAMALGCKEAGASQEQSASQQTSIESKSSEADEPKASQESDASQEPSAAGMPSDSQEPGAADKTSASQQTGDVAATPTPQHPVVVSIADDGFLNIREMPMASSKIVGRLITGGEGAEYLGSTSNWINVRYKGVEGYVNGKYARIQGLEEQSMRVKGAKGKVYYVVIGSYESIDEAKKSTEVLPDALDGSNIYRTTAKGKTVYRLCAGCYYKRKDAQSQVDGINEYLGREAWVWESDGVAPCVYQGIAPSGELTPMGPQ